MDPLPQLRRAALALVVATTMLLLAACGESSNADERLAALRADPNAELLPFEVLVEGADTDGRHTIEVATTADQLAAIWDRAEQPTDEPPEADFATEVVFWFASSESSSCPADGVIAVVLDGSLDRLYPRVASFSNDEGCTADAIPWGYAVSVPRDRLPSTFEVWWGPQAPRPGSDGPLIVDLTASAPS